MYGFNITPELLMQAAKASFQPPQAPAVGFNLNPQLASMQRPRGFGVGDAMALAGLGLQSMRPTPVIPGQEPQRTAGDADLGGYGRGGMVDVGRGQMLPNPNGMTYDDNGMPIAAQTPQVDPLTGLLMWVGRQFRPRGA